MLLSFEVPACSPEGRAQVPEDLEIPGVDLVSRLEMNYRLVMLADLIQEHAEIVQGPDADGIFIDQLHGLHAWASPGLR